MAISLNQINRVLLALKPTVMGLVTLRIMAMWIEELCTKFIQVHGIVEERWRRARKDQCT